MISLHRSMHSSQMYTPGPAMSFFTCFCDFPQKEHFSRSPPSPIRATYVLPACGGPIWAHRPDGSRLEDRPCCLDVTRSRPGVVDPGPGVASWAENEPASPRPAGPL